VRHQYWHYIAEILHNSFVALKG